MYRVHSILGALTCWAASITAGRSWTTYRRCLCTPARAIVRFPMPPATSTTTLPSGSDAQSNPVLGALVPVQSSCHRKRRRRNIVTFGDDFTRGVVRGRAHPVLQFAQAQCVLREFQPRERGKLGLEGALDRGVIRLLRVGCFWACDVLDKVGCYPEPLLSPAGNRQSRTLPSAGTEPTNTPSSPRRRCCRPISPKAFGG